MEAERLECAVEVREKQPVGQDDGGVRVGGERRVGGVEVLADVKVVLADTGRRRWARWDRGIGDRLLEQV